METVAPYPLLTNSACCNSPWSRNRPLGCSSSGGGACGWGDAHEQGDVGQSPSLPDSASCFSPKLQPCACGGAKPMQLSQRKPVKREMLW